MDKAIYDSVQIGERFRHVDGFTDRFSTVIDKVTDRWGRHLKVQMEDGTTGTVHSFDLDTPRGTSRKIGHYLMRTIN